MPRFKVAHIREQGVDLIIVPLDSSVDYQTQEEQQAVADELQLRARAAGLNYTFGGRLQRAAVAVLWQAFHDGTVDVLEQAILTEIESDTRELRQLFRGHPAWGTLIQRSSLHGGPVGCYRLV